MPDPMPLATILWVILLVAAVVLLLVALRRLSRLVARTRSLERFQRGVESIDRRFAGVILPLVRTLDETRRHTGDPAPLGRQVADAQAVLETLSAEAGALAAPAPLAGLQVVLTGELERATRAIALVAHGLDALGASAVGRDLEAQTALKRGVLNLRHAQEAFALRARDVAAVRPADLASASSAQTPPAAAPSTWAGGGAEDVEEPFDPRM